MSLNTLLLFGMEFINDTDHKKLLVQLSSFDSEKMQGLPLLITPNVDQIVKFHRKENLALFEACKKAAFILPDGQPIVWTSKLKHQHQSLQARLTGSDLFPALWNQVKKQRQKVFMILPNEDLGLRFKAEYDLVNYYVPPFFNLEDQSSYKVIKQHCEDILKANQFDHVFIGLGFPKQEHLSLHLIEAIESGPKPLFSLLGASFEFYFGVKNRAPLWIQKMGLEFLHRMFSEPGRMVKRYLWDDLAFFPLLWKEIRK
jgi:N-acetylglucosaminyldiphosphoundecaprenol N-acetyl-beta-D-mannosaminyltransferase